MSERTRSCQEMTPEDEEWLVDAPGPEVWAGLPRSRWEDGDLLRRLDDWREGEDAGPLIRWAAVHLRGCKNEGGDPSTTASVSGAPQLDASALSSQKPDENITPAPIGFVSLPGASREQFEAMRELPHEWVIDEGSAGRTFHCSCGGRYEEVY